eukprot:3809048-Pyramimonas_sp.AAC.1
MICRVTSGCAVQYHAMQHETRHDHAVQYYGMPPGSNVRNDTITGFAMPCDAVLATMPCYAAMRGAIH